MSVSGVADAGVYVYGAYLSGSAESPPNSSQGTGTAWVTIDDTANTMRVEVVFSGLTGKVTASHIHAATTNADTGTAGVATRTPSFAGFPSGVTAGTYDTTYDMTLASTWNAAYVSANGGTTAGATSALIAALNARKSYLNIHTSFVSTGEIRGFLHLVPEPSTVGGLGMGIVAALGLVRRRAASRRDA